MTRARFPANEISMVGAVRRDQLHGSIQQDRHVRDGREAISHLTDRPNVNWAETS